MKVLIIYHAGARENPRQIYQALVQTGKIELIVIIPRKLRVDRVYDSTDWLSVDHEENCKGYRLISVPRCGIITWLCVVQSKRGSGGWRRGRLATGFCTL
jgi:hypothetical protein